MLDQIRALKVVRCTNLVFQDLLNKFMELSIESEYLQPQLEEYLMEIHEHERTIDLLESANKYLIEENITQTKKIRDLEKQLAASGTYRIGILDTGITTGLSAANQLDPDNYIDNI